MLHGRDKEQSRRNRNRIRDLLMREWDPIRVKDEPRASDEYDSYVGEVYVMLMYRNASADAISAYLDEVRFNYMGLSHSKDLKRQSRHAAEALVAMRSDFQSD